MASEDTVVQAGRTVTEAAEFSRLEHAAVGTMYMTCTLGGLVTNVLLILTLLKDKAIFQRTTPWLHINLALANIGVVAPSPLPASSSFSGKWLYGEAVCQAYAFEGMFIGLAAIGSVISLCVERYVVSCRKEAMQQNSSPFYWLCTSINVGNALFWAAMPILGWARRLRPLSPNKATTPQPRTYEVPGLSAETPPYESFGPHLIQPGPHRHELRFGLETPGRELRVLLHPPVRLLLHSAHDARPPRPLQVHPSRRPGTGNSPRAWHFRFRVQFF